MLGYGAPSIRGHGEADTLSPAPLKDQCARPRVPRGSAISSAVRRGPLHTIVHVMAGRGASPSGASPSPGARTTGE